MQRFENPRIVLDFILFSKTSFRIHRILNPCNYSILCFLINGRKGKFEETLDIRKLKSVKSGKLKENCLII